MMTARDLLSAKDTNITFRQDGAELFPAALSEAVVDDILAATAGLDNIRAGVRLYGMEALHPFLRSDGPVGAIVAAVLGPATRPVRAVLFNKTSADNWALRWHQDRTIAVANRIEVDGFGPWTVKDGELHVAPPFDVLANMVTVRVHLDDVPETNAPLLIAPGSHRLGRVAEADVADAVQRCGIYACVAEVGDIWLYATPILHASKASERPSRRRVLQVDYAASDLPGGLCWRGI